MQTEMVEGFFGIMTLAFAYWFRAHREKLKYFEREHMVRVPAESRL